jgi:hypothetical protein
VLQIYTGIVYAALVICTIFNIYVAIRGRSNATGHRIQARLLVWCTACGVIGVVLLVMALTD